MKANDAREKFMHAERARFGKPYGGLEDVAHVLEPIDSDRSTALPHEAPEV